ncbi:MAG: helix-turn-helix domain-containing protein [Steroidobacteraceae bacterium]|nr:helix-turn-helix domain-containing protein [Steroidobacteraceae bacterium]
MSAGRAASPGVRLRAAREALGLSIEDAADRLRLNAALVLAMEEERFALLGAPVFARGHLRNYAQLLGVPEREVVAAVGADDLPEPSFLPALDVQPRARDHSRWAWPVAVLVLAGAVAAVIWWWTAAGA